MNPKVSIIIPVHNKWELTAACLRSLAQYTDCPGEVIVVDNGSADETYASCPVLGKELFSANFSYLRLSSNLNFAPACNIGAKAAKHELLFFLNNDTLLTENWLPPLLAALESSPCPTAVGPMLLYPHFAGQPNRVQHLGLAFEPQFYPVHMYEGFPADHPVCNKRRRYQALTGAALLLPKHIFFENKGFDEHFINGGEDVALGLRLTAKQHILTVVPESRIYHLASQTPGIHDHAAHNAQILRDEYLTLIHPDMHFFAETDRYVMALTPGLRVFLDLPERRKELLRKQVDKADEPQALQELTEREPLCHAAYPKLASLHMRAGDMRAACDALFLALKMCPHPALAGELVPLAKAAGDEAMLAHAVVVLDWYEKQDFAQICDSAAGMRQFMKECGFDAVSGLYEAWLTNKNASQKYYKETKHPVTREELENLRSLVDEQFYLAAYPDVRACGISAAEHYVRHGFGEGRVPNARFSKDFYLRQFPELASSGEHPLAHYARHAKRGGLPVMLEEPAVLLPRHDGIRQELKGAALSSRPCKVVAWYLPQYHPIGENDLAWGKGFTEWSNVAAAVPRFEGHAQPHLPGALGFYDLRRKEALEEQIMLARHAGIHGFCLHHYWFAGKRILRAPLEHFKADPALDFPFCLHWANESWTKRWDGGNHELIIPQKHSFEDSMLFIKDIAWALADPRYMRFQGKPMLGVYRPSLFADMQAVLRQWRAWCRENGIGDIFLFTTQAFENSVAQAGRDGFDAIVEYPPHTVTSPQKNTAYDNKKLCYSGTIRSYLVTRDLYIGLSRKPNSFPVFRGVMTGWDNSARTESGQIFDGATEEEYGEWLERTLRLAEKDPYPGEKYVFINSWNEWAESAYLEPDARRGFSLLNTTAKIMDADTSLPRLLFVCEPEDLSPASGLAELLRANRANPAYRPVVYVPHPIHTIGTFQGLAPLATSFNGRDARERLALLGYFSFAACILLGPGAAKVPLRGLSEHFIVVSDGKPLTVHRSNKGSVWSAVFSGAPLPQWTIRNTHGGRAIPCADLLRDAREKEAERKSVSIILLPSQADPMGLVKIFRQMRFQASFDYEIVAPEDMAACFSGSLATPVRCIEASDAVAPHLPRALRQSRGYAVWFLSAEDRPRATLPEALLPCFVDESIVCARSYERAEEDALPHIFTKHTYRMEGSRILELARSRGREIFASPASSLFRRAALLDALESGPKNNHATLLDMAQKVYARGDVALVPAQLLTFDEYGDA